MLRFSSLSRSFTSRLAITLGLLLVLCPLTFAENRCDVRGTVYDQIDAVAPGIIITFSGNSYAGVATSGDEGTYTLNLKEDTYEIYLRTRFNSELYKRAKFKLRCANQPVNFNIYTYPRRVSWGDTSPETKFSVWGAVSWFRDTEMNVVISYMKMKNRKDKFIYYDSTLSYDEYNIKVYKMTLDFDNKEVILEGPGWMEKGKDRRPIIKSNVSFNADGFNIRDL